MKSKEFALSKSETVLALSGLFILVSVLVIALGGGFLLWTIAKILYAVGVVSLLLAKDSHVRS